MSRCLSLIVYSYGGLAESELLSISGVEQTEWSSFYCSFKRHLVTLNGKLNFSHQYIRNAVLNYYAGNEESARRAIIIFFKHKYTIRSFDELSYQYSMLEDYDSLYKYLVDFDVFEHLFLIRPLELARYWYALQERDKEKYSFRAFCDIPIKKNRKYASYYLELETFMQRFGFNKDREFRIQLIDTALKILEKDKKGNRDLIINCQNNLAIVYFESGDGKRAMEFLERVVKLSPQDVTFLLNLGSTYRANQKWDEAMNLFQRALSVCGEDGDKKSWVLLEIGLLQLNLGRLEESIATLKKALQESREVSVETARCNKLLGDIYKRKGDGFAAKVHYNQAYEMMKRVKGELNSTTKEYLKLFQEVDGKIAADEKNKLEKQEFREALRWFGAYILSCFFFLGTVISAYYVRVDFGHYYAWWWGAVHGALSPAYYIMSLFSKAFVCRPSYYNDLYAFLWWVSLIVTLVIDTIAILCTALLIYINNSSEDESSTGDMHEDDKS